MTTDPDWIAWMQGVIAADATAQRRGITLIRLTFAEWEDVGEPVSIEVRCADGLYSVPVMNNGRKPDWVSWHYRRASKGRPACRPLTEGSSTR